ncbi:MAG: hypothetical protein ONB48_15065 [candidate division KSB1 bacterium]|nr:hypothetical protein [candidate division KSB1 bacterium]MDZ7273442.1 hypothetical protein [candidate division KSB1 bacterium]MDZ7286966.1 hypothetical protein [candidate division KSB1 bacterium]MDZ7299681.1 hypothetical protein [candidate division KSB1 bacterium]MDZ7307945.1 hypothetical protein [candidate division KSB1 bacterium]
MRRTHPEIAPRPAIIRLGFLLWLGMVQMVLPQTTEPDTAVALLAVDEQPRSDSVSSPAVAFDRREYATFVWQARFQKREAVLLRQFDAIGRALTNGIVPVIFSDDTVAFAGPDLAFTPGDSLWVVWEERSRISGSSEVFAQVFNRDLKPLSGRLTLRETARTWARRPRVVVDAKGRVLVAWIERLLPGQGLATRIVARYFDSSGRPLSDIFPLYEDQVSLASGEQLDLAASSSGLVAATWEMISENLEQIFLCVFEDAGKLRVPATLIAQRNVGHPSLTFLSAQEILVQWQEAASGSRLVAQRFDLQGRPLAPVFAITAGSAGEIKPSPATVLALSDTTFASLWSELNTTAKEFHLIQSQIFDRSGKPLSGVRLLGRTPNDSTRMMIEVAAARSPYGNFAMVYDGNDRDPKSDFPRVAGLITQFVLPDLSADSLQVVNVEPTRADSVRARFLIRNNGRAPAANSSVVARVLSQRTLQIVAVVPVPIPLLLPGESRAFRVNLGTFEPGLYFFGMIVDQAREIPEAKEDNNIPSPISFTVLEAPTLVVSSTGLQFTAIVDQSDPVPPQVFNIRNGGSGILSWRLTADQPWLRASPQSGLITSQTEQVAVSVNVAGLAAGTHLGALTLTSNGGTATVLVTLIIRPAEPRLALEPAVLRFAATQGSPDPPAQNLTISNTGNSVLRWQVRSNRPWITVFPDSGSTTQQTDQVAVRVTTANLGAGSYEGSLMISSNGGEAVVTITLEVSPLPAALRVIPTNLNFTATEGLVNPPAQPVLISNTGGGTLNWSVSENFVWLSVWPASGTTSSEVDTVWVAASISTVRAGSYSGFFSIESNGGTQVVSISFLVNPQPPVLAVDPPSLSFTALPLGPNPAPQRLIIRNAGGSSLNWFATVDQSWLQVSPTAGDTRTELDTLTVAVNLTGLMPGTYNAVIRIASTAGDLPIGVTLAVQRYPDLQAEVAGAVLEDCRAADYNFRTAFTVTNAGPGTSTPTTARLLLNGALRQTVNVPGLELGANFNVAFAPLSLPEGNNELLFEAGSDSADGNAGNNRVRLQEWVPRRGDANLDSLVDLRDLFYLVDVILQRRTSVIDKSCWAANAVVDEHLDVADLIAIVDLLLNETGGAMGRSGKFELQAEPVSATQTRLRWHSPQLLRAWQARCKLAGGGHVPGSRSVRSGAWEVRWRFDNEELSLLVMPVLNRATAEPGEAVIDLPVALTVESLLAARGLSVSGEMLALEARLSGGSTELPTELPKVFTLMAGYPNPWQPGRHQALHWRYDLPAAARVEAKIYNLLGQEVWRFTPGVQAAGRYSLRWEGRNTKGQTVASGAYFLELIAGAERRLTRFIVQ